MCTNLIELKRKVAGKVYTELVPCGVCPECLKKKQSAYVVRTIEEVKKRGSCCFVTLTYNDEHLLKSNGVPTLCREHLKKWKREVRTQYFRKYNKSFPSYSFILCGEYGPRHSRPHYHGLLLGLDKFHLHLMADYWEKHFGFVVFENVPMVSLDGNDDVTSVARYVAKYCIKPAEIVSQDFNVVEKPRIMTSVGYGIPEDFDSFKRYHLAGRDSLSTQHLSRQDVDTINSRSYYQYKGFKYSLPLYYRKKIFYEKGINGNLKASSLSYLCKNALRSNSNEDFNNAVRSLADFEYEGQISKAVPVVISREKASLHDRQIASRQNLLKDYKTSKF